jgi:hydroxymethylbilane synthase
MHKAARLRLGTRGSPLALWQARAVAAALCRAHGWAEDAVAIVTVTTTGDRVQDRPLADIGGKALWTKELDRALLVGDIDIAVHSAKDIESVRPPAIALAATLPRADVRDRIIGVDGIERLTPGMRVGTASPRRAAQLLAREPALTIVPFRGNVATRIDRVARGEADATLLAAAGLHRLGIDTGVPLPAELMLPAPGQGAIGIECRSADAATRAAVAAIDDAATTVAVRAERAVAAALGGSCHSPLAAFADAAPDGFRLRAEILAADGSERVTGERRFAASEAEASARELAQALLGDASAALRALFGG